MAKMKTALMESTPEILDAEGKAISSNPALIVYHTDVWGMTTDLKASVRFLAARVCGCPEKYKVVQDTLVIALEHLRVRFEEDKARLESEFTPKTENTDATQEPKAE